MRDYVRHKWPLVETHALDDRNPRTNSPLFCRLRLSASVSLRALSRSLKTSREKQKRHEVCAAAPLKNMSPCFSLFFPLHVFPLQARALGRCAMTRRRTPALCLFPRPSLCLRCICAPLPRVILQKKGSNWATKRWPKNATKKKEGRLTADTMPIDIDKKINIISKRSNESNRNKKYNNERNSNT